MPVFANIPSSSFISSPGTLVLRGLDCGLSLMCRVESESQCDGASDQNYSEEDERNGSKIPLANHHDVLLDRERFCPGLVPIPVPDLNSWLIIRLLRAARPRRMLRR